jgi:hypothetical protein
VVGTELKEEFTKYPPESEMIELIKKHCSKWIKESKGEPAFRGMLGKPQWGKFRVRQDRIPKDTPKWAHEMIDADFEKKFKWKPRTQGLFVTGNDDQADVYGDPYLVFPIGNFKILWSPDVEDLYQLTSAAPGADEDKFVNIEWPMYLKSYRTDNLSKALQSGYEVMVKCKSYYALSHMLWFDDMTEVLRKGWQTPNLSWR